VRVAERKQSNDSTGNDSAENGLNTREALLARAPVTYILG